MFVIFHQLLSAKQVGQLFCVIFCLCTIFAFAFVKQRAKFLLFCYLILCNMVFFSPTTNGKTSSINLTLFVFSYYNLLHILQNIALFVPLGFLLSLWTNKKLQTLLILVFYSVFVEFAQLFIDGRRTDLNDLLSNTIGAIFGVMLAQIVVYFGGKLNGLQDKWSMLKGNFL